MIFINSEDRKLHISLQTWLITSISVNIMALTRYGSTEDQHSPLDGEITNHFFFPPSIGISSIMLSTGIMSHSGRTMGLFLPLTIMGSPSLPTTGLIVIGALKNS